MDRILGGWRHISVPQSILHDAARFKSFTVFARLVTSVNIETTKTVSTNLHGIQALPFGSAFVRGFICS